jgi:hypothetical protein
VASEKTKVIERLFFDRYDRKAKTVARPVVTGDEVAAAIRATKAKLSTRNTANFFKDIVRSGTRNENFPTSVVAEGWTAEQFVSGEAVFRFVPLPAGQTVAFAEAVAPPELLEEEQVHVIQSVSLPLASRRMGRSDESWLTQVAVRLHIIDTHLAVYSQQPVINVDLLQTGAKLGHAEVDAVFLAILAAASGEVPALVSCEVKSRNEVLELEQVLRGAQATAVQRRKVKLPDDSPVIPMAIKALGGGLLWVVEFATTFPPLVTATQRVYRLEPPVTGVG